MRVCVVTSSFDSSVVGLCNRLSLHHTVHLVYLDTKSAAASVARMVPGCELHPAGGTGVSSVAGSLAELHAVERLRMIPAWVDFASEVRAVVRRENVEVVCAQWAVPSGFLAAAVVPSVPLVTVIRGSDIHMAKHSSVLGLASRVALVRSRFVIAVSESLAKQSLSLGNVAKKTHVIHSGVDIVFFHSGARAAMRRELGLQDLPTILYVGNLTRLKRVDMLIRTYGRLAPNLERQLVVVGSGPEREHLVKAAAQSGAPRVHFLGPVAHGQVAKYMRGAEIMVVVSEAEGLPNVVLEGMASGCAVVATGVGGIPEVIQHGRNGLLVKDEADLEAALQQLLEEPSLTARIGAAAAVKAATEFDQERSLERVEGILWSASGGRTA